RSEYVSNWYSFLTRVPSTGQLVSLRSGRKHACAPLRCRQSCSCYRFTALLVPQLHSLLTIESFIYSLSHFAPLCPSDFQYFFSVIPPEKLPTYQIWTFGDVRNIPKILITCKRETRNDG